ncbi:High osmolarity signaling protein SHO1 [Mycena venus]|uniref:High osmolarity signaling protein SHO1 n=1 Tax=Mycena venus TaxID=2733690 RepID=A0A8H7D395_9AGAR|nr:High osmolarity signaling protein SHO1 [Mycena venus]
MSTTNSTTVLVRLGQHTDEAHLQLVRGSLSDPTVGRTLRQVYSHVGDYIGLQANRAAHRWGRGPSATAARIAQFFGTGKQREVKLAAFRVSGCSWLEEECSKLVKYALPRETAQTQIQAFKSIVATATRYHGTRALFLKSKHLRRAANTEAAISAAWTRADDTQTKDWKFYSHFAAACLSEKHLSTIVENISPECLGTLDTANGDLSVIERLLILSESSANSISDALAQRYLVGILELPTFWHESGPIHTAVFIKILDRVVCILKDFGLDQDTDDNGLIFDDEGIDDIPSAVLVGILSWRMIDPKSEHWYHGLAEILQLLRTPRAEYLLPKSSALATDFDIENIIPDPAPETLVILANNTEDLQARHGFTTLMVNDNDRPQSHADRISLQSTTLNEPVNDPGLTPDVVYTEVASLQWTTLSRDFFRARRWSFGSAKKEKNKPVSTEKAPTWMPGQLRNFPPTVGSDGMLVPVDTSNHSLRTAEEWRRWNMMQAVVSRIVHF